MQLFRKKRLWRIPGIRRYGALAGALALGALLTQPAALVAGPSRSRSDDLIRIRSGCFRMGTQRNYADERPRHRVCLARFVMDRYEVTVGDYARCVTRGRCSAPVLHDPRQPTRMLCNWKRPGAGRHPINCVTWKQARRYCAWVGKRLPTEAEWERVARDSRARASERARATCATAVLSDHRKGLRLGCGAGGTLPVGSRAGDRSAGGVMDLTGNVSEWTRDWFSKTYYGSSPTRNPRGPKRGRSHALRGCSFRCIPGSRLLHPTARQFSATWDPTVGFRCVRSGR